MVTIDLSSPLSQAAFGALVGISQQAVSDFVQASGFAQPMPAGELLLAYTGRLREQAAGRLGSGDRGLDLTQERAALAREQRIAQALKNAVARREYAPVGVIADVLGAAASAVVDRMDQLEGRLRKACPDLPDDAKTVVMQVLANARNEWVRSATVEVEAFVEALATLDLSGQDEEAPEDRAALNLER